MRFIAANLLAVLSSLGASLQTDNTAATPNDAPYLITAATNLVVVRVVVRDSHGRPVANLTKDDFKLFDRGREQNIAQFSMETLPAPTSTSVPAASPAAGLAPSPPRA